LIGYKGVKIHEISEKYGVQVKFPSEGEGKLVKIYGSPEGIEGAKAYLLDFVKQASENQVFFFLFSKKKEILIQLKIKIKYRKLISLRKHSLSQIHIELEKHQKLLLMNLVLKFISQNRMILKKNKILLSLKELLMTLKKL